VTTFIQFEDSYKVSGSQTPSGHAWTLSTPITAGHSVVVFINTNWAVDHVTSIVDSGGSTWTKAQSDEDANFSSPNTLETWYCLNSLGATTITPTWTSGSTEGTLCFLEFSGVPNYVTCGLAHDGHSRLSLWAERWLWQLPDAAEFTVGE
jgi:hypothetical protein